MACRAEIFKVQNVFSVSSNTEDWGDFNFLKDIYLYDENGQIHLGHVYEAVIDGRRQIYISFVKGAEKYLAEYITGKPSFNYRVCVPSYINDDIYCYYFKL